MGLAEAECVEHHTPFSPCQGEVRVRVEEFPTSEPHPRCQRHFCLRAERYRKLEALHPDVPVTPEELGP